jgi:opacity protein-like surface antigen
MSALRPIVLMLTSFLPLGLSHAVNPPNGWYGGIFLGPTYTPKTSTYVSGQKLTATHSFLGNIGGEVGYSFKPFRLEGELFYNSAPLHQLSAGSFKINTSDHTTGVYFKGKTNTGAFMINGYYDYIPGDALQWAPYVGAGIGYAEVSNSVKFYQNKAFITGSNQSQTSGVPAAQGIVGIHYYVDDYFTFGLDYRYFITKALPLTDSRMIINSVNLSVSGSLNCL